MGELSRRETCRILLVWWVLAILCRSQRSCLFNESREVLWVNAVNIGAVLRGLLLILCGEFINFMLELFYSVHEMCFNCFQSKYLCNHDTLELSGVVDLAFTWGSFHVLHSVRQVEECGFSHWRFVRTPQKIKGEMPRLNYSKSFWDIVHVLYTKRYFFCCSIILPPESVLYMKRKQIYIGTELFIKGVARHFPRHKPSGKVFLLLDGFRAHCSSAWLFQSTVENNVTIICLQSHYACLTAFG
jgi:hypothetical protein